jgi:hypothetical protein
MKFTSNLQSNGLATVTNLPDPSASTDAATKGYVDSAVEGLAWKDSCRVATQSNINISSPGATIDGITLSLYDRVLVKSQTSPSENGIRIFNGSSSAMTRAADCSTSAELEQAVTTVEEGTSAGSTYRQTSINFTLDSGDVTWTGFGTAAGAASESTAGIAELATQAEVNTGTDDARIVTPAKLAAWSNAKLKYTATFGDGAAIQYDITHNLGTKEVMVQVRQASDDAVILCDITCLSTTVVRLNFASAPASNALKVVILG